MRRIFQEIRTSDVFQARASNHLLSFKIHNTRAVFSSFQTLFFFNIWSNWYTFALTTELNLELYIHCGVSLGLLHTRNIKEREDICRWVCLPALKLEAECFLLYFSPWWGDHGSWLSKLQKVNLSFRHWVSWKWHSCEHLQWRGILVWNHICKHDVSLNQLSNDGYSAYLDTVVLLGTLTS